MTKKYCTFDGRARRKEFFGFLLGQIIAAFFGVLLAGLIGDETAVSISAFLFFIIYLLPDIGVSVRRLHDVGRSGFWALPYYLVFFLRLCSEMGTQINNIIGVIGACLMFASFPYLIFIFFKSDEQENQYGPVPEGVFD